jgi:mono/diheme cytochrome c family protein
MTANRQTTRTREGLYGLAGARLLLAASLVLVSAAAGDSAPRDTKADALKRGEMLARENCSSCHAIGVKGDSPNPKSPPFRTLSQRYQLEALEEALGEGITMGHGEANMPHFIFEPDDIGDLISYLKKINRK